MVLLGSNPFVIFVANNCLTKQIFHLYRYVRSPNMIQPKNPYNRPHRSWSNFPRQVSCQWSVLILMINKILRSPFIPLYNLYLYDTGSYTMLSWSEDEIYLDDAHSACPWRLIRLFISGLVWILNLESSVFQTTLTLYILRTREFNSYSFSWSVGVAIRVESWINDMLWWQILMIN